MNKIKVMFSIHEMSIWFWSRLPFGGQIWSVFQYNKPDFMRFINSMHQKSRSSGLIKK